MKKILLLTALFAMLFTAFSEDENTIVIPEKIIPESDINSVKKRIWLEDN